jgi:hypothetical protein
VAAHALPASAIPGLPAAAKAALDAVAGRGRRRGA